MINCEDKSEIKMKRKAFRKQKRCKEILLRHEGLESVNYPTKNILIGNGGLICGITREYLMELFIPYGLVNDVLMIPDKPYAFVIYFDDVSAKKAMDAIHGRKLEVDGKDIILYLGYTKDVPKILLPDEKLPPGLVLIKDFVNQEEEGELLDIVKSNDTDQCSLKHRKVKHFGYEFNYAKNDVNKENPLEENIPLICAKHMQKLMALGHISKLPDQLTVNTYAPGQGIPPHVDTHSAFEDQIVALSLGSQVTMDFYHPENGHISVLLPRRSVIIMTGESRYLWKHGITPRKTDVISVLDQSGYHLTVAHRETRTSFTFRFVRKGSCRCEYKEQCNSQIDKRVESFDLVTEEDAKHLEKLYVAEVYNGIADHFSDTRYKPWPRVSEFLSSISHGSILLDIGCGNGKYLGRNSHYFEVGCDASSNLIQFCSERNLQVLVADCLSLPFRSSCADACLCIAVVHHMSTETRRKAALEEISRILRPGGRALVYVWALEQERDDGPSNYLSYSKMVKKYQHSQPSVKQSEHTEFNLASSPSQGLKSSEVKHLDEKLGSLTIPVHKNRTHFEHQDVLVPWHKKRGKNSGKIGAEVYHRFYHVFIEGELESLLKDDVKILKSYYDQGNWCVIFEKL